MADSTQSSVISSSHGLPDASIGQGLPSAEKDAKLSLDPFLSSTSPVSLIQSSQEGMKEFMSNKLNPSESVAPSLKFPSEPDSLIPVSFDGQVLSENDGITQLSDPEKDARKVEGIRGVSTDSGIEAVSCESSEPVTPVSGTGSATQSLSPISQSMSMDTTAGKPTDSLQEIRSQFSLKHNQVSDKFPPESLGETQTWSDSNFLQFKEQHYETTPPQEKNISIPFISQSGHFSPEQDSPESPFEVLADTHKTGDFGKEFQENIPSERVPKELDEMTISQTKDQRPSSWIDEHDTEMTGKLESSSNTSGTLKSNDTCKLFEAKLDEELETFANRITDNFESSCPELVDVLQIQQCSPVSVGVGHVKSMTVEAEECKGAGKTELQKASCIDDLGFMPTAYILEKPDKSEEIQAHSEQFSAEYENVHMEEIVSFSPPPNYTSFGFESDYTTKGKLHENVEGSCHIWPTDPEPPENLDADSSGESDDTVIEDISSVAGRSTALDPSISKKEKADEHMHIKVDKLMLVPIINVIETEEQIVSEEEEEVDAEDNTSDFQAEKEYGERSSKSTEISSKETEDLKYGITSVPLNSIEEIPVFEAKLPEADLGAAESSSAIGKNKSQDQSSRQDAQLEQMQNTTLDLMDKFVLEKYVNIGEVIGDNELSKPSTAQVMDFVKDLHPDDQQNVPFHQPLDVSCHAKADDLVCEMGTAKLVSSVVSSGITEVLASDLHFKETSVLTAMSSEAFREKMGSRLDEQSKVAMNVVKDELSATESSPETASDPESIEPECSVSAATDSFVEFMRECLKSRQDVAPEDLNQDFNIKSKQKVDLIPVESKAPKAAPTLVLDFEQEQLTIKALKELGESLEDEVEEEDKLPAKDLSGIQDKKSYICLTEGSHLSRVCTGPQPTSRLSTFQEAPDSHSSGEASAHKEVEKENSSNAEHQKLTGHALTALLTPLPVRDLIYWRDLKKSGTVFAVSLLLLLSLAAFSIVSVVSYLLLALLSVTITFRVYKSVVQAVQKSDEGHPFKAYMEKNVTLSQESFRRHVDTALSHFNCILKQLMRLFLVEDLVDSLKLAVVMWLLTYVGAIFNGITLLIIADILIFSVPVFYEKYKAQIDHYVGMVREHIKCAVSKVQAKVPGVAKRKAE
ncbi:reticulon-3 isoform X2 [Polypterus senegalus]|uniref:reticulon-3 isoform X2 n=1 Tax=Polypterus senegalus TaxID=55291 RepID=UPI001965DCAF|nr:reticulon-3 isoform X2 [Polypterus senegalus]